MEKRKRPGRARSALAQTQRVTIKFPEETPTKQSFRDECDINNIMSKFQRTGVIDHVRKNAASYGFASAATFTESMQIVANAQSLFEQLPAAVRKRFDNEPTKFLDFVEDPVNADELVTMGLADKPAPLPPLPAEQGSQEPSVVVDDAKTGSPDPIEATKSASPP